MIAYLEDSLQFSFKKPIQEYDAFEINFSEYILQGMNIESEIGDRDRQGIKGSV